MGNTIGSAVANTMASKQKEMQKEMAEIQMRNMILGQERMRRQMIAQQMAMTRERLYWLGGTYALALLGVTAVTIKTKSFPKIAAVPLTAFTIFLAYTADFAYGTKIDRVNKMTEEILNDQSYWFTPILPEAEVAKDGRVVPKKKKNE